LSRVLIGFLIGVVLLSGTICMSSSPGHTAGWSIIGLMLALQALGIHIMWTITWNIIVVAAYLIDSETFLAITACMGFANICAPWYIGRIVFWKANFSVRAIYGLSHWATTDCVPFLCGFSVADIAYNWMYWGFIGVDQVLHALPTLMLLQHCAETITPECAIASFLITVCWLVTVSLKHRVVDWKRFHQGFLKYIPFGDSSCFEPHAVAQLYLFENPLYRDTLFMESVPGWSALFILSNIVMLTVTLLPNSASIIFHMGGGSLVPIDRLWIIIYASALLGITGCCVALGKTFRAKLSAARRKEA